MIDCLEGGVIMDEALEQGKGACVIQRSEATKDLFESCSVLYSGDPSSLRSSG